MREGLRRFLSGAEFASSAWTNSVKLLQPSTEPGSNITLRLPVSLPSSGNTGVLTTDSAGTLSFATAGNMAYVGEVRMFAMGSVPTGWLECDGSAVSRTTYATLFTNISTTFGVGNGSTTFNLPDYRGRSIIGRGTGSSLTARALGDTGGAETHVLQTTEMPAHTHAPNTTGSFITNSGATTLVGSGAAGWGTSGTTASTGGGGAHNNMQPFGVAVFAICFDSLLASQSLGSTDNAYEYTSAGSFSLALSTIQQSLYKTVRIFGCGGGGGGGSGARQPSGTAAFGGGGGGSGGAFDFTFSMADILALGSATLNIVVGAAGTSGAARTSDATNGADGGAGGNTTVTVNSVKIVHGYGGTGGQGGTTGSGNGGVSQSQGTAGMFGGNGAASATNATPNTSLSIMYGPNGGGAGGGIDTGNTARAGSGAGGGSIYSKGTTNPSSSAGGAVGNNNGGNATTTNLFGQIYGDGGGGGGANTAGVAGSGGNGARGAGGGGGGASRNGNNSGAGGTGGAGVLYIRLS